MEIIIDLPWPPSTNSIWRGAGRHVYRSKEYTAWIAQAHGEKLIQKIKKNIKGKFEAFIVLNPPDKRQRDIDNYHKAILDFAQASKMIENDRLCQKLTVVWSDLRSTIGGARLILTQWYT